jgi:hypothetical protein
LLELLLRALLVLGLALVYLLLLAEMLVKAL